MIPQPVAKAAAMRIIQHRLIESATSIEFELQPRTCRAPETPRYQVSRNVRWRRIREALSEAQNHRCCYCGNRCEDDATVEHVVARYHGGTDAQSNLVMACKRCNELRGCRNAYDFFKGQEWLVPRSAQIGRQIASMAAIWPGSIR